MSDLGVGDIEIPYLDVTPADGTTVATLTVLDPALATTDVGAGGGDHASGTQRWTADQAITFDQPGWWVLTWTVDGTGAGTEPIRRFVVPSPAAGGPTWTPGRTRVADYVPSRTLGVDARTHQMTFDSTTRPTGVMVDQLIADGVAWVTLLTGAVHATLHDAATACAAIYAAWAVEQGYPDREAVVRENAIDTAAALLKQATQMRADLARANGAVNGTDPTNPGSALLPIYSFPPPVSWGDSNFL